MPSAPSTSASPTNSSKGNSSATLSTEEPTEESAPAGAEEIFIPFGEWCIRSWRLDDAAALVTHANNHDVWLNLRDSFPYPYTEADARAWLLVARLQQPETTFAIADSDSAVGGIGIQLQYDVYRRSAEIGYWLGEPYWGRGIATMAVRAMTRYAFHRFDIIRLFASVFAWNPASARVLEKAGYRLEGRFRNAVFKDGRVVDQLMYGLTRIDMASIPEYRDVIDGSAPPDVGPSLPPPVLRSLR